MISAQVVKTSITVNDNSPFQGYPGPDNHTTQQADTTGFKPFTVKSPEREHQAKKLNLPYRPYSKGNPSQVIFRLSVSGLPGIILHFTLLGCFGGE